ncbi:MAG: type II secretion system protein [Bacteroidales bacterium]|nr:type II secretion system protein [Bacteroidales bacterium]
MIKTKNPKKAFTIVELVIVIAVVAILMTIMFVGGTAISNNAKFSTLKSDLRTAEVNIKAALNDPDSDKRLAYGSTGADVTKLLNEYLEDDFQIKSLTLCADDDCIVGTTANRGEKAGALEEVYQGQLTAKDPWGKHYEIYVYNLSEEADSVGGHRDATTDWAIVIKSLGKNKLTLMHSGTESDSIPTAFDRDDNYLVVRTYNSVIYTDSHVNTDFAQAVQTDANSDVGAGYTYVDFTETQTVGATPAVAMKTAQAATPSRTTTAPANP